MLAKKCDKCGCLYENYNSRKDEKKPNGFRFANMDEWGQNFSHSTKDLCPKCMDDLLAWWNGGTGNGCNEV